MIFLFSIMSRAATILFILKQAAAHAVRLAKSLLAGTKGWISAIVARERSFLVFPLARDTAGVDVRYMHLYVYIP
jgi:hypothetical protein